MDFALFENQATALLLHVVRVGAFLAVVPLFGRQSDSFSLRLVLSLSLASMLWWNGTQQVALPVSLLHLGVQAVGECVVGFALGLALSLLTSTLVSAGEIVSTEMGFAMARALDPDSGGSSTVVSQLFQVLGFLMILHLNIHHEALRILQQTFECCPVGEPLRLEPVWAGIRTLVGSGIVCALQYAFPLMAVMLLLTVGLVLFGRAVPAVNLMEFSFTVRVLVALVAAVYFLSAGTPFLERTFADVLSTTRSMFPVP